MLRVALEALPPDVAVVGQRDVGEQRVALLDGAHRVRVGLPVGARRDAEEAELRVDRVEPAVLAEAHPRDVVADGLGAPARDGRLQHRQVGLAAGRRERRGDVVGLLLRADQLEDQHVLGQPALVVGDRRGDPQRVALLAEQRVAAVAGAVAPDLPGLREVRRCTWSRCTATARRPGRARAGRRPSAGAARTGPRRAVEQRQHRGAHPGHDLHRDDDVLGVGDLDAEHRAARRRAGPCRTG